MVVWWGMPIWYWIFWFIVLVISLCIGWRFARYEDRLTNLVKNKIVNDKPHDKYSQPNTNANPNRIISISNKQFANDRSTNYPANNCEEAFYALILRTAHNLESIIGRLATKYKQNKSKSESA
jgi:hypothetical protein